MNYPIPKPRPMLPTTQPAQAPQQGLLGRLNGFRTNNRDALLQLGVGLMSGGNAQQQMAMGAQGFGGARLAANEKREAQAQKNKTLEFLARVNPQLAEAVSAGAMSATDAYGQHLKAQTGGNGEKFDAYGFPRSGAISQKVRAFQMQGIEEEKALGLATGRFSVSINPQTGERVIVDVATGEIVPLTQPEYGQQSSNEAHQPATAQTAQNTQGGLYDQADSATGVGSSLANASSNTLGQIPGTIGDMATFPDSVKAAQEFDLFKRDLIRSLSLNPRFPVAEQQRIENLVPRGIGTAPGTLKQSLQSLDAELSRIESELTASVNNPQSPIEIRQQDAATLRGVQAARQRMAVPQGENTPPPAAGGDDLKQKYGLE